MHTLSKTLLALTPALIALGSAAPAAAQSASGDASVTIIRPATITKNTNMVFGTIIRPTSGNGTVALSAAATTARSVTGDVVALASTTPSAAKFTIVGEGGQSMSVSVPATFALNPTSGAALTVTTSNNIGSGVTLSNALGSEGSFVLYVGGSLPVTATTPTGDYTGSFTVTASYN